MTIDTAASGLVGVQPLVEEHASDCDQDAEQRGAILPEGDERARMQLLPEAPAALLSSMARAARSSI